MVLVFSKKNLRWILLTTILSVLLILIVLSKTNWRSTFYEGLLKIGPRESRRWAIEQLKSLGSDGVHGLTIALDDPDYEIRDYAAFTLCEIGPQAKAATPELIKGLGGDESIQNYACQALLNIGEQIDSKYRKSLILELTRLSLLETHTPIDNIHSNTLVGFFEKCSWPELNLSLAIVSNALNSVNPMERESAFYLLSHLQPYLLLPTQKLINFLSDPNPKNRRAIVISLSQIKHDDQKVIPILVKTLDDLDPLVKLACVNAIGEKGKKSRHAIPAILRSTLLQDDDHIVVAENLIKIDPMLSESLLKQYESNPDPKLRESAKKMLDVIDRVQLMQRWAAPE